MRALLGKIIKLDRQPESAEATAARFNISFKPTCLLPQRTAVPAWLNDQVLTVGREVADAREVGRLGDSIVLRADESSRWLYPLTVTPEVSYGRLPEKLQLHLRWWKNDKAPDYTVRANGQVQTGSFEQDTAGWSATLDPAPFFDRPPHLPVTLEITCDTLKVACTVLPSGVPAERRLLLVEREVHRIENNWCSIDVTARSHGGAILAWRERGRPVDHFATPGNLIQPRFENGGHIDRYKTGWGDWSAKMVEAALSSVGSRRESGATRLLLEGVVDEGESLRTSVAYTLYDHLPLLLLQRDYNYHGGEKKDDKDTKPRAPIDELHPLQLSFRSAARAERQGRTGSRLLCADGDRLSSTRPVQTGEHVRHEHWRLADGWAVVEHPERRECLLYLFDKGLPPYLGAWLGPHAITLEPCWDFTPLRAGESAGYAIALCAGELAGAAAEGCWVACRAPLPSSGSNERPGADDSAGVRVAAVGRLRAAAAGATTLFTLAGRQLEVPVGSLLLPGVGEVHYAVAGFAEGKPGDALDVTFAGIGSRRPAVGDVP